MLVPLHPSIVVSTFKSFHLGCRKPLSDIRLFRLIHFLVSSVYSELMDYSYAKVDKRVEYQLTLNVKKKKWGCENDMATSVLYAGFVL